MKRLISAIILTLGLLAGTSLSAIDIPLPSCYPCPPDSAPLQ
jgi:hypothetical protein